VKYILDTHSHTVSSGHSYSTISELAQEASKKGLSLISMTDHASNFPGAPNIMYFFNMHIIPRKIHDVIVLRGVELNILDIEGNVDFSSKLLGKLEIVIASLHSILFIPKSKEENTLAIINTIKKNPNVNIIGHLADPKYPFDIEQVVKTAKLYNVAIEINNSSLNPNSTRFGGEIELKSLIESCIKHEVFITFGSDAHVYSDIGNFSNIEKFIQNMDIPENLILNTSVEKLLKFLNIEI
jgi:putative hydrolase